MVFSPFRSAISHAPRAKPTVDDPFDISHRPPGSRRPHPDVKVRQVRRLVETTTMTYAEISQRSGVPYANISRWANEGHWTRPLFAPRAPDTVPRWRARRNLRRRTLAARIDTLAEQRVCALEAAPGIDLAGLREAIELIKLGTLADRPHTGRHRPAELRSELDEPQARARVIADLRANGVDIARAPGEALSDFIESCAGAADPARNPAFRARGRYSKRKREHQRLLERE
ncbi:MAG: hypothetical protein E6G97_05670 [Alphaproteobacteria bacterium]|nr:MAG: hypothetical protein E6G97_05670 [Alphaproteobacteria bacterium]